MKKLNILSVLLALYLLFSMVSISISQIFLALTFLFWLVLLVQKKQKFAAPSFFWALLVYSGLSLVASVLSVNPQVSFVDSRELLLFLVIPLAFSSFFKEKELKTAHLALLASASISLLFSFFYFLLRASPGERVTGFMGHYMTQAGLLLLFCAVAMSMFVFLREKIRFVWGLAAVLSLGALILTLTRSAWIGIVVAGCIILFLYKPKVLVVVPVVMALVFLASPWNVKKRALSIFSLRGISNIQRIEYLRTGIQIIKEFPLFGTGPDTVDMVFQNPKYGLSEDAKRNVHLHNNLTQIGAERGIPALLAWLTFMVWALLSLVKLLKNKDPLLKALAAGSLAALFALAAAGLFEYNWGDSEITTLFLYLITAPFALDRIIKSRAKLPQAPLGKQ